MEFIFSTSKLEEEAESEEQREEIRAVRHQMAAACERDMQDDNAAAAAAYALLLPEPSPMAAAADDNQKTRELKTQKLPKETKYVHGEVPQHAWEAEDVAELQRKLDAQTVPTETNRSDMARHWGCKEWCKGKRDYINFRKKRYAFQALAFAAANPDLQLQKGMTVVAWPCENELCVTPSHLFLKLEEKTKRGRANSNYVPLNKQGEEMVRASQEQLHRAKQQRLQVNRDITTPVDINTLLTAAAEYIADFMKSSF